MSNRVATSAKEVSETLPGDTALHSDKVVRYRPRISLTPETSRLRLASLDRVLFINSSIDELLCVKAAAAAAAASATAPAKSLSGKSTR